MRKTIITAIFSAAVLCLQAAATGQWNAYLAYQSITDIEPAGNVIFVLSSQNLYSYNVNDKSITAHNTTVGMSDTGIRHIAWCSNAKRLVIVYENNNIDLLNREGNVVNISEYFNKSMTEDKTVNNLYINGVYAYLSTGFGIVKINVKDGEISNTYMLNQNVLDCIIKGGTIYAKTEGNILAADMSQNLLDRNNWHATAHDVSFNDENDIVKSNANGYDEYVAYDQTNRCCWSNQKDGKMQCYTLQEDGSRNILLADIRPDGPEYNHFFFMNHINGQLYTAGGGKTNGLWLERPGTIQVLKDNIWTIYQDHLEKVTHYALDRYTDIMSLDVNPLNSDHVVAGNAHAGVFEFSKGQFTSNWTFDNSMLQTVLEGNYFYVMSTGVKYDKEGNLWILNSWVDRMIVERTKEGEWIDHTSKAMVALRDKFANLRNPIFDSRGLLWFVNDAHQMPALVCYNKKTDETKIYKRFTNQDGTTINIVSGGVRCMAEDNKGNIWIGTTLGPLMLTASEIESGGETFTQVKVPRNDGTNYADYLLSGIDITSICMDGAGRKWFGTSFNGAYLISENNIEEVQHFTKENSQLFSNTIESIAIDPAKGEVFFGTDKGLCSYMSDATGTAEELSADNVYAYPNPVRPDYTGVITVVGLTYNADVKITTSNGVLVAQGKSKGGAFTWDGKDKDGRRVASGIYMVHTATNEGNKGVVCKIAMIK